MLTNLADFYRTKAWEAFIRTIRAERADEDGMTWCAHCGKPIIYKYDCIATTKHT